VSRATSDLLDMLHGLVAQGLREELERAIELANHEQPDQRQPINPQLIDKALKFLKDNSITAPLGNKPVSNLAATLADLDLEEEAVRLSH